MTVATFDAALAEVKRLGLHPIAGGDGSPDPEPAPEPEPDPQPDPEPEPDHVAELARLREENARLQGEIAGRAAAPPPAPPKPATQRTLDDMSVDELDRARAEVEAKIDTGDLTASRGASLLGEIAAVRREKLRDARDAAQAPLRAAETKLRDYIGKYPDLGRKGSELLGKVAAELPDVVQTFGFSADDPRAQVIAVERVVAGPRLGGGSVTDLARRKIPVGGAGSGPAGGAGATSKPDPVKEVEKLYPDQVAYWDRMHYTPQQRAEEAPFVLQRRARRIRQTG
jgi:hypothetical protein